MLKMWHNVFYKRNNSSRRKYFDLERGGRPPDMGGPLPKVIVDMSQLGEVPEHVKPHKKEMTKKKELEVELSEDLKKDVEILLTKFFAYQHKPKEFAAALNDSLLSNTLDVFQKFPQVEEYVKRYLERSGVTFEELIDLIKISEKGFDRQKFNQIVKKIQSFGNGDPEDVTWLDEFYSEETQRLLEQGLQFSLYRSLSCIDRILSLKPGNEHEREAQKKYLTLASNKILVGNSLGDIRAEIGITQSFIRKAEVEDAYKSAEHSAQTRYEKRTEQINHDIENALFPLVSTIIRKGDQEVRQKTFDLVGAYCERSKDQTWSRLLLNQMCIYKIQDKEKFNDIAKIVEGVSLGFHEIKSLVDIWKKTGDADLDEFLSRFKKIIDKQQSSKNLKSENFDFEKCAPVWQHNFYGVPDQKEQDLKMKEYAANNVKTMLGLENHSPGMCKRLTRDYGIRNYARYTPKMLEEQDAAGNEVVRYGIVLYPYDDHNGAFSSHKPILEKLSNDLKKKGVLLRVVEAGTKSGIAKRFLKLDQKYGRYNKIECAVVGAHGSVGGMTFGRQKISPENLGLAANSAPVERSLAASFKKFFFKPRSNKARKGIDERFAKEDVEGKGVQRIGKVFREHPSVVLVSCSTGKEDAVGQNISAEFDAEVSAPTETAVFEGIDTSVDEKFQIHLTGRFVSSDEKPKPIETALYVKGTKKPLPKSEQPSF